MVLSRQAFGRHFLATLVRYYWRACAKSSEHDVNLIFKFLESDGAAGHPDLDLCASRKDVGCGLLASLVLISAASGGEINLQSPRTPFFLLVMIKETLIIRTTIA
jgi:hypothetical protein